KGAPSASRLWNRWRSSAKPIASRVKGRSFTKPNSPATLGINVIYELSCPGRHNPNVRKSVSVTHRNAGRWGAVRAPWPRGLWEFPGGWQRLAPTTPGWARRPRPDLARPPVLPVVDVRPTPTARTYRSATLGLRFLQPQGSRQQHGKDDRNRPRYDQQLY